MVMERWVRALVTPAFVGFVACQVFVSADVPAFTCTGTDLSACPAGMYCKGAGCVPCEAVDICDGYDNDCSGVVDDGASDRDNDGYSSCGRIDPETQTVVDKDCDDDDPDRHPGATETCNGRDDDCDGITDNPGLACKSTELCLPKSGTCIAKTQACSVVGCVAPQICDAETEHCVNPPTADLGGACSANSQCKSKVCGDAAVLTLSFTSSAGSLCTKPCCTSNDCPTDFICLGTGTGGNFCVPKDKVDRPTLGTKGPGTSCESGTQCRSGRCDAGRCLDACCRDDQCTVGTTCRMLEVDSRLAFHCSVASGTKSNNASCSSSSECKSAYCLRYGEGAGRCAAPCCTTTSCPTLDLSVEFGDPRAIYTGVCGSLVAKLNSVRGTVLTCQGSATVSTNGLALGTACTNNDACRSGWCHPSAKTCTDVCCLDSDCTKIGSGWTCRPTASGSATFLGCTPP